MARSSRSILALLIATVSSPSFASAQEAKLFTTCNQAERVFTAKLDEVNVLLATRSLPPIFSMHIKVSEPKMLRGLPPGDMKLHRNSKDQITIPPGSQVLIAASTAQGGEFLTVTSILPLDANNLAIATKAVSIPIGWTFEGDGVLSPWAKSKLTFPKTDKKIETCAKTGRPAFMAGPGLELKVEQVRPKVVHEFKNPYGDGEFTLTLTNKGPQAVDVPALLTHGKDVLWPLSLVIVEEGKAFVLPNDGKVPDDVKPLHLAPNQSVSTTVNTLALKGIAWPNGGSRVQFQFCLGELSQTGFFYFFTAHHNKLIPR